MSTHSAHATDLSCVSTTFNALSPNDKVCVSAFEDPKVPGIVCHISQARKGGWGQPFGLNEDPSNFSVSCRQNGPIDVDLSKLGDNEEVFSQKTSIFFKTTRIYRLVDKPRNTLVYLAISTKISQWLTGECDQHRSDHAVADAIAIRRRLLRHSRNYPILRRGAFL